ncbi:hypothetical protein PXD04_00815 [Methanosphaera sp. ISO3-F5]|uniref:hypothetical protein n=1 Tax=Methanosphaera sp. ISO3-F5 TaxID=1452353 RepID=UPI002B259BC0|nr:hypothetical protein [Methanosphaera sp. ISO3-F5]WQH64369.1 hypothetical protein PXD04_00815 [Methanosphaera sp. ISO3-F5]
MINKKFIFITLIFALIISLTAISATDISNNDTTITTADQTSPNNNANTIETPQTHKTINKNTQTNTKEASNTTVTSYTQLYETLTNPTADEDTTVNLDGEEKYTITNTINVSKAIKNLIINGNGKTIDGNNTTGFLFINHTCNLTINNLTLENCKTTDHDDDSITGAIFLRYGNVLINNTKMNNNNGTIGSAINIQPYTNPADIDDNTEHVYNVTIQNSEFNDNEALLSGGAIAYVGITGSNFTIENCTFTNNGNNDEDAFITGGAVYISSEGNVLINNSEFNSNIGQEGGALYAENGNTTITNTEFLNNHANYNGYGGALYYNNPNSNTTLTISNVTFDSNGRKKQFDYTADDGGAAYINTIGNISITDSKFINNSAQTAGAVHIIQEYNDSSILIENTLFDSNGFEQHYESTGDGGAITAQTPGNISIVNSSFANNIASEGGALSLEYNNLEIINSNFDNNGIREIEDEECGGAAYLSAKGNTIITNSKFTNNRAMDGGAIYYEGSEYSNLSIADSLFDNNIGNIGGTLQISSSNTSITNTNFTNNLLNINMEDEIWGEGIVIYSNAAQLTLNHTNFRGNGLPSNLTREDIGEQIAVEGGLIYFSGNGNNRLSIDYTNFTSNRGYGLEGGIITYSSTYQSYDKGTFILNHTAFKDNILVTCEEEKIESEGYILLISGSANIDNTIFLYNKIDTSLINPEFMEEEKNTGVIYFNNDDDNKCNITNCVFIENTPANFIVNNSQVILNYSYYEMSQGEERFELMFDGYIPTNATVMVYVDESSEGTQYQLKSENITDEQGNPKIRKVYVDGLNITDDHYVYKLVITQTPGSQYYDQQDFINNTYYFIIPHDYAISVNATTPIKVGDNTTIKGKVNFTDNEGKEVVFIDKPVDLYINGTYIATTNTDSNGEYEFNYTGDVIGTHDVQVTFNKTIYLPRLTNNTNFTVVIRESVLNITASPTKIGEKTNITFNLTDKDGDPIPEANITFYIDNKEVNITTGPDGVYVYECELNKTGDNYVLAFYDGDYAHTNVINSTIFSVEKINTTVTVSAANTTIGKQTTIKGKLVDEKGNNVPNAQVIVFIDDEEVDLTTNANGEFTYNYTTKYDGANYVEVFFEGNDTHKDSFNHATFNVTKKAEAQIDIDVLNDTVGNVEIEVTVTDEKGEPLKDQTVEVTLPNGTKTNMTTDKDGKIKITDTTTPEGKTNITVKVPDTADITGNNKTQQFTIEPDYQKILDELEKTSVITAIPEEGTVDDSKVTVTLDNKMGTPISNAPITVKNSKGEIIGNATTDNKGIAVIPVTTKAGTENITVSYLGNSKYTPAETTVTMKTAKNNVTVTVDPVNGVIGEKITLTAHVLDTKGNPVNGGNLVFKLNGKTLRSDGSFNSTASAWKFTVKNGLVTVTINADLYLRNAKNLTASYSGSYKYNEAKSSTVTAQIKKRNAQITVTTSPGTQKQYQVIALTAKLTDKTPGFKNTTMMHTGTKVLFKINGKTLKDAKGNNVQVKVNSKNVATYKYTVPAGMGGVTNDGKVRDYSVEAVLVSDTYYPDTRDTATFNVERSPVTINIAKTSINNKNVLNVQATIKDYKGKNVIGTNQVNIKINGKSYVNPSTGKTQNFQVTDGKISLKNIQIGKDITVKSVMIVTGARQAYLGARNETSNIVKA